MLSVPNLTPKIPRSRFHNFDPISTNQFIDTSFNQLHPLGLIPHGYAGFTKEKGFFLHATAVRKHQLTMVKQPDHLKITYGVNQMDVQFPTLLGDYFSCARVQWQNYRRMITMNLVERFDNLGKALGIISVLGTVERGQNKVRRNIATSWRNGVFRKQQSGVLHDIPHLTHFGRLVCKALIV